MPRSSYEPDFSGRKSTQGRAGCLICILITIAALVVAVSLYNRMINERVQLDTPKVSVMKLDSAYEGFSVLHISDLQASALGSDPEVWKKLLSGKHWSVAVLTGDMVGESGNDEPFLSLIHTLQTMYPNAPVCFIAGDGDPQPVISEPHGTSEVLADWVRNAQQLGAIYLDAPLCVPCGKRNVWISPQYLYDLDVDGMIQTLTNQKNDMEAAGTLYENEGGALYRSVCWRLDSMQRSKEAIAQIKADDLQIAVNHSPLQADYVASRLEWADVSDAFRFRSIDLMLCGHYCAGGWCLPDGRPVYVPDMSLFPDKSAVSGLQRINTLNQYVSPGIGAPSDSIFKSRLFNRPAVSLIKFTSALQ